MVCGQRLIVLGGVKSDRLEAMIAKTKVTVRMSYGFRNAGNPITLLMMGCSDIEGTLPGGMVRCILFAKKCQ